MSTCLNDLMHLVVSVEMDMGDGHVVFVVGMC
jgi:hypothetical protein